MQWVENFLKRRRLKNKILPDEGRQRHSLSHSHVRKLGDEKYLANCKPRSSGEEGTTAKGLGTQSLATHCKTQASILEAYVENQRTQQSMQHSMSEWHNQFLKPISLTHPPLPPPFSTP